MDRDNNNNRKQKQPPTKGNYHDTPPSPSHITGDDTTACTASIHTHDATESVVSLSQHDIQERMRQIEGHILHLTIASGASFSGLAIVIIPLPVLMGMLLLLTCLCGLFSKVYQLAQLEFQSIVQGHGIGRYLPASLYQTLVHVSIHEWLTDTTFIDEYRYMALYFVPGVTREQIDAYVDRLVPRHRNALRRPGLGHLLGPSFMRLIVGEEGLSGVANTNNAATGAITNNSNSNNEPMVPRRLELTQTNVAIEQPELLDEDDNHRDERGVSLASVPPSANGNNRRRNTTTTVQRNAAAEPEAAAATAEVPVEQLTDRGIIDFFSGNGGDDDDEEEDLTQEMNIIVDAISDAISNLSFRAYTLVSGYARDVTGNVASTMFRTGLTVGTASLGIGLFGIYMGFWEPPTRIVQRVPGDFRWQRSTVLLSSSLASGALSGIFMMSPRWSGGNSAASTDKKSNATGGKSSQNSN